MFSFLITLPIICQHPNESRITARVNPYPIFFSENLASLIYQVEFLITLGRVITRGGLGPSGKRDLISLEPFSKLTVNLEITRRNGTNEEIYVDGRKHCSFFFTSFLHYMEHNFRLHIVICPISFRDSITLLTFAATNSLFN
ncbi:hypothetical protein CDAR_221671 [Caerostris darwini]|uniref:Uncharacterized protein n=1 Tax=Caerostris darwini TaxID=1538125 RepID=A0AAV4WL39_9ARAC|nr:hypothetical protein CDAR_221671 [Caerostris darwini]